LLEVLGDELLSTLLGVPAASISQPGGEGLVAERLAWIGQVVWHLQGTYNHGGIRQWFGRPRAQLEGRSPVQALDRDWKADGMSAAAVLRLAKTLAS
jgi:hypothetical protein